MSDRKEDEVRSIQTNTPDTAGSPRPLTSSSPYWQRALLLPLTILAWMVIGIIVLWLLGHILHALLVIVLAVIVTFAVAPLVQLFERRLIRPFAIAIAYLLGIGIMLG